MINTLRKTIKSFKERRLISPVAYTPKNTLSLKAHIIDPAKINMSVARVIIGP